MISALKLINVVFAKGIAICMLPVFLVLGYFGNAVGRFAEVSLAAGFIPFRLGEELRYMYYKFLLKSVGRNVRFKFGSYCQYRRTIIGNNVVLGYFNSLGEVHMGDDVLCGGYVNFLSGLNQHSFDDPNLPIMRQAGRRQTIKIGSDIWIGSNCVISADISDRCVVGAGSVVIKPVESKTIVGGNPAKLLKELL